MGSFAAAPRAQYAAGPAQKTRQVTASRVGSGGRHADAIEEFVERLTPVPGQ